MTSDPQIATLPQELQQRVKILIEKYPETADLIGDLIDELTQEPRHKKAKTAPSTADIGAATITFPELSFLGPQRKRFKLALHDKGLSLSTSASTEVVMSYDSIAHILCLATPGKQKAHYTWVILPRGDGKSVASDTIVFATDDILPKFKPVTKLKIAGKTVSEQITASFAHAVAIPISRPQKEVFISSECKDWNGDPAHYVNCYDRAKDGFLFFFRFGVFFGFKKPLVFYPIKDIKKMEITGITARFCNLHIVLQGMEDGDFIEYSMVPIAEHKGLAAYIAKQFSGAGPSVKPTPGPVTLNQAFLPDDEKDEDYMDDQHTEGVEEEFDSDHETDTQSSIDVNSEDGDEDEDEGEASEEESSKAASRAKPISKAQAQMAAIEVQRQKLATGKGTKPKEVDVEEDLDDSSEGSESGDEENEYDSEDDFIENDEEMDGEEAREESPEASVAESGETNHISNQSGPSTTMDELDELA
ncbi:hypothetical protein HDV03_001607 [Kappamyces sp. JEL0829]|nr:hypothetical protein HDV03_001607 [Kappamyces sp. JEL0829]